MADWMDRTIRGPVDEYMDAASLRKLFSLPEEFFAELVRDGVIPPPIKPTARTVLYSWRHAVFLGLWLELNAGNPPKVEKKSGGS